MAESPASPSSSSRGELEESALCLLGGEGLPPAADGWSGIRFERDAWPAAAERLRHDPAFSYEMLISLTAVDWNQREPRFDVVYHLWSLRHNRVLRIKVGVPEVDASCPSVVSVWPTANWHEREVLDLFGIRFDGHPDPRRILMPDDYPHHPLRKDFPVQGIDNSVCYRREGGVLMTPHLEVDRPAGQDLTPVDRSRGDPEGFSDLAEPWSQG